MTILMQQTREFDQVFNLFSTFCSASLCVAFRRPCFGAGLELFCRIVKLYPDVTIFLSSAFCPLPGRCLASKSLFESVHCYRADDQFGIAEVRMFSPTILAEVGEHGEINFSVELRDDRSRTILFVRAASRSFDPQGQA